MLADTARSRLITSTLFVAAVIGASFLTGCTTNPTTGRSQLTMLSREDEMSIGASQGPELTKEFGGEVQNASLRNYVTEVGMKLKDQTEADGPQRTWVFTLLDSDVINAFALPGERVFMSRGLADQMTNEAQLAGVLGHEIGHVMAKHSNDRMAQSAGAGLLAGIAGVVAGATVKDSTLAGVVPQVVGAGGQVVVLKFSRAQESEADALGMRYMTKAGYNPKGQLEVMQILEKASSASGGSGPEILATHPLPATRIREVQDALASTYAYTQTGPDARNYQFFPERYKQRYLDLRAGEPKKAPAKKKKAAMHDASGRTRLLATVDPDDAVSWCSICQARAALELPFVTF
jgi:predicted Zn-dependent protease